MSSVLSWPTVIVDMVGLSAAAMPQVHVTSGLVFGSKGSLRGLIHQTPVDGPGGTAELRSALRRFAWSTPQQPSVSTARHADDPQPGGGVR